jgi:PTH2 family peptidyl-tRNA hydrolase
MRGKKEIRYSTRENTHEMITMSDYDYKQLILVRDDLKLPKGKLAAQAAHASVEAVLKTEKDELKRWRQEGMAKIALKVADEKEVLMYLQRAKDAGFVTALITDAGHTVVEPGTRTCGAVGPAPSDKLDEIFGKLKLL